MFDSVFVLPLIDRLGPDDWLPRLREIAEMGLRQAEREEHLIENLLTAHRLATGAGAYVIS